LAQIRAAAQLLVDVSKLSKYKGSKRASLPEVPATAAKRHRILIIAPGLQQVNYIARRVSISNDVALSAIEPLVLLAEAACSTMVLLLVIV